MLELKFTDRFPLWFNELVRGFGLRQCGAAKYADGVTLLSGHLPPHRRMPSLTEALAWPPQLDAGPELGVDPLATPSHVSVARAIHPKRS